MGELGVDITIEELDPRRFNEKTVSKILTQANIEMPGKIDITSYKNWKKQHNDLLKIAGKNIGKMQDSGGELSEIIANLFSEELYQAYTKFLDANPHIEGESNQLSENQEIRELLKEVILENIKKNKRYFRNIFAQKSILSSAKYTSLCLYFIQKDFLEKTTSLLRSKTNSDEQHILITSEIQKMKDKGSSFIGKHSELKIEPAKYIEEDAKSIMEETLAIFFKTLPDITPSNVKKEAPRKAENAVKERSKPDKKPDKIGELKVEIAKKLWEINDEQDFNQKKQEIKALINKNIDKLRAAAKEKESSPLTSDLESIVHMLRINDLERFNKKFSDRVAFDNFDRKKLIKSLKLNFTERRKFHKARADTKSVDPKPAESSHSSSRKFALFQKKASSEVASIKKLVKEEIKKPFKKR